MPVLRFNYQPGVPLKYEVSTDTSREIIKGSEVVDRQTQQVTTEVIVKPIALDDEGFHVLLYTRVTSFKSSSLNKGEESVYTATPEELMKQQPYKVYVLFDRRGQIKEMIGGNEVSALVLPEGDISVGDSWIEESLMALPMMNAPVKVKLTYTLNALDGEIAEIGVRSEETKFSMPLKIKLEDGREETFMADYLLEIRGTFKFDVQRGIISSHELNMNANVKMELYVVELSSTSRMLLRSIG